MEKQELLYEGKAKKVFTTEDPDLLIVDYKEMRQRSTERKKERLSEKVL